MADNRHLTLSNRIFIEKALNDNMSRKAIADHLGKDKSTICKEIKKHTISEPFTRILHYRTCTYDCTRIKECGFNTLCSSICGRRIPAPCRRKDSSSGEEAHMKHLSFSIRIRISWAD